MNYIDAIAFQGFGEGGKVIASSTAYPKPGNPYLALLVTAILVVIETIVGSRCRLFKLGAWATSILADSHYGAVGQSGAFDYYPGGFSFLFSFVALYLHFLDSTQASGKYDAILAYFLLGRFGLLGRHGFGCWNNNLTIGDTTIGLRICGTVVDALEAESASKTIVFEHSEVRCDAPTTRIDKATRRIVTQYSFWEAASR